MTDAIEKVSQFLMHCRFLLLDSSGGGGFAALNRLRIEKGADALMKVLAAYKVPSVRHIKPGQFENVIGDVLGACVSFVHTTECDTPTKAETVADALNEIAAKYYQKQKALAVVRQAQERAGK